MDKIDGWIEREDDSIRFAPHPSDCACDDCRAVFDELMWGWLNDEALAIVEREARTGDIPDA